MNNTQVLLSVIKDEGLEDYWSDINTKSLRVDQLQSSRNIYLRLVALHVVKKDESFSDRKIANHLNSFL